MNVLFVTLLLVGTALSATIQNPSINAEGPKCPIEPSFPLEAGPINITVGPPTDIIISIPIGSGHQDGGIVTGLQDLKYTYNINVIGMTVTFDVKIPGKVCMNGDKYNAAGVSNFEPFSHETLPTGNFVGSGGFQGCATESHIAGSIKLRVNLINQKVSVTQIFIDEITSDAIEANLGQFEVDGKVVDWAEWSAKFKTNFEAEWPTVKTAFLERAKNAANVIVEQRTLQEWLDLISEGEDKPCPE